MSQIHGSGTGNWSNTAVVDDSGRLYVNSLGSGNIGPQVLDQITWAAVGIDESHHKIHRGVHYSVRGHTSLASSGDTLCFGVTTPSSTTWSHMKFQIEGVTLTEVRMWEGATLSGGTLVTLYNSNRNSTNTSTLTITSNPTISGTSPTSGTLLESNSKGVGGATPSKATIGGNITREDEWVLRSGTAYLWEIKTGADNNIVDYNGYWYEAKYKTLPFS